MKETFKVTNDRGIPFVVRVVRKADRYGLDNCLIHNEDEPLVEVYDARYAFTQYGQFVSRYYMNTILEGNRNYGIDLYGGEPAWKIDAKNWNKVRVWLMMLKEAEQELVDVLTGEVLGKAADVWGSN